MINQHPGGERPAAGLVMEQIGKRFASVTALNAVTLRLNPGEIHGLIGENGAGKSTLIKILAGVYQADSGSATLDGHPLPLGNPAAIEAAGIRVIHQELNLIPHFTVAESVFLGQEYRTRWGALDRRRMKAATAQFFQQNWQLAIDPERLVRDLSLAERKLVQIARALIDGAARLVVFDEPTAPLEAQEASLVSSAILRLRDQGIAILYISHYLNEIATLCDRGTVLRNGEVVGYPDRDLLQNTEALIAMMVGREIDQLYTPRQRPAADNGATPLLSVRQLSDGRQLQDLSFDIQPGEIVGVAGLLGAGRDVLVDLLYGLRPAERGTIHLEGRPRRIRTPKQAIRAGMALVPRDRRHQGLILPFTTADNINLASLPETATFGWERRGLAEQKARDWIVQLAIRPGRPGLPVRYMSGGNQQKAILARWLGTNARLFILDEPTLGVDIGARRDIYQRTRQLADQGRAVLVSSSDAPELLGLCDRILVLWRGALAAGLPPLLATLSTSVAFTGLTDLLTGQRRIAVSDPLMVAFRDNSVLGLPWPLVYLLGVFILFQFLLHHSRFGQHVQAVGGNRDMAQMSGLNVRRLTLLVWLLAGIAAGLAILPLLSQGSGSSSGTATPLLLETVLATFIGAAFSRRRVVTIWGALLGAILVNALSNGLGLLGVNIFWMGAIKGGLILVVLAASAVRHKGGEA
ncbi:TPA: ATP-binding cassette domain-containing protein [Klebsiella pneumoniae subsp. pneumoniae]|nr:ATP-binding cassette domain-containing protein [Klebsiella pneumoniae subsp. pneumoniae]